MELPAQVARVMGPPRPTRASRAQPARLLVSWLPTISILAPRSAHWPWWEGRAVANERAETAGSAVDASSPPVPPSSPPLSFFLQVPSSLSLPLGGTFAWMQYCPW